MTPYYEDHGITIYHGDCRELLPSLESVDVVLTDPPYSAETHEKQWIAHALTKGKARFHTKDTGLGFDPLDEGTRTFLAVQFARLARRWVLAFCDLESIMEWRAALEHSGLEYIRTLIWDKVDSAPQFTGDRPANGAEAIVLAHPKGKKRWNGGGRRNVFRHPANGEKGSKPHPSTKPLPLMKELVVLFTEPGELVLDPMMGSGTTLEAARDLRLRAIGIEQEERHCEYAAQRLSQQIFTFDLAPSQGDLMAPVCNPVEPPRF